MSRTDPTEDLPSGVNVAQKCHRSYERVRREDVLANDHAGKAVYTKHETGDGWRWRAFSCSWTSPAALALLSDELVQVRLRNQKDPV